MSTIPTNRESDRYMLRLPDGMRDRIKAAAEANNRSMNAEIVATLEEKYPAPTVQHDFLDGLLSHVLEPEDWAERIKRIDAMNEQLQQQSRGKIGLKLVRDDQTGDVNVFVAYDDTQRP